ncbi:helix-turn-helix transcriptional regulator, partial [Pseudomonas syringae pv. tagetis]
SLVKCELWLLQVRMDLAVAWLLRLNQTYSGGAGAAGPEFHPQLPQHIELQRAVMEQTQGDSVASKERLQALERCAQEV